jgi:hypothetical protein
MVHILSDILSLEQYFIVLKTNPKALHPEYCPHCCFIGLSYHGFYTRKSDRSNEGLLNPIPILRFFCSSCRQTCSVLPECISPQRWYVWGVQEKVLSKLLKRQSVRSVSIQEGPTRSTCRRWFAWLQEKMALYRAALCSFLSELGRTVSLEDFWETCLGLMPFSKAMRLCHFAGVMIP